MSWTRRGFLGALGAVAAAPFVRHLLANASRAADGEVPRRLVVIYTGQGHHIDQFSLGAGQALSPLAPFAAKTLVLRNLRGHSGHYEGHAEALTGQPNGETFTAGGGPSLDQLIAARFRGETILPSLELGCFAGNGADGMIAYSAAGLPIPTAPDPRGVFDRMFRQLNQDPAVALRQRAQDRSVLDVMAADYRDLEGSLSVPAMRLLDAHLTIVREQEQALAAPFEVRACDLGAAPEAPVGGGSYDYPTTARLQMDNIAAALACDVTRVATMCLGYAQNTTTHRWLGHTDDFHQIAHGAAPDSYEKFLAIDRWQAGEVAHLVGRLEALGILDATAVVWVSELGLHRFDHSKDNAGVVLAGSAGGYLRGGGELDLGGASYQDLLLTLGHAFGLTELTRFGSDGRNPIAALRA